MRFKQYLVTEMTQKELVDLEIFADRLLKKFNIDIEFTRHFLERVNNSRNNPEIVVTELQRFFKKIKKQKGSNIKRMGDMEVVLKDMQTDINFPVVIDYKDGEFVVTHKTIMRKKEFKTSNKVVKY